MRNLLPKGLGLLLASVLAVEVAAKVSPEEAARLGRDLTPLGAERAGNADGTIPSWDGGLLQDRPPAGQERHPGSYSSLDADGPLYVITAENAAQHRQYLTVGQLALLRKYPDTYRIPVYSTRRTGLAPDFVYEATRRNAEAAELSNDGETLQNAITGIPFPIPKSGQEVIWNHKLRYRGLAVRRYNTQIAVQSNGSFQPYKMQEDVRFHYNHPDQTAAGLGNVVVYFLQHTLAPVRQAGTITLVHETMDQVAEPRRAWQYNPGQRRIRRAPNVGYDNPGNGSDGLRTNDQLDGFNGATDRYTWKIAGKREMIVPYNAYRLADDRLTYKKIVGKGHINPELTRYERHRVWVVEAELKPGTSHIYKRRTFYVDEDTWSILAVDLYDRRNQLWRVQESHPIVYPWRKSVASACGVVYDLQANRYLVMDLSNEEPLSEDRDLAPDYFSTSKVQRLVVK